MFFLLVARPEKGVATYTLSPNRQRLFPNFWHTAIFNTFRRFRHQVLYVAPPFIVAYSLMQWAIERYVYRIESVDLGDRMIWRDVAMNIWIPRQAGLKPAMSRPIAHNNILFSSEHPFPPSRYVPALLYSRSLADPKIEE